KIEVCDIGTMLIMGTCITGRIVEQRQAGAIVAATKHITGIGADAHIGRYASLKVYAGSQRTQVGAALSFIQGRRRIYKVPAIRVVELRIVLNFIVDIRNRPHAKGYAPVLSQRQANHYMTEEQVGRSKFVLCR